MPRAEAQPGARAARPGAAGRRPGCPVPLPILLCSFSRATTPAEEARGDKPLWAVGGREGQRTLVERTHSRSDTRARVHPTSLVKHLNVRVISSQPPSAPYPACPHQPGRLSPTPVMSFNGAGRAQLPASPSPWSAVHRPHAGSLWPSSTSQPSAQPPLLCPSLQGPSLRAPPHTASPGSPGHPSRFLRVFAQTPFLGVSLQQPTGNCAPPWSPTHFPKAGSSKPLPLTGRPGQHQKQPASGLPLS